MKKRFDPKAILYTDTLTPDLFLSEYLPLLTSDAVKIYMYSMFLWKTEGEVTILKLENRLSFSKEKILSALEELSQKEIITLVGQDILLNDIKRIELDRLYKEKTSLDKQYIGEKEAVISAINNQFFDGNMPIYMYANIETWFQKYKFEDAVMMMLFTVCKENGVLTNSYIETVAKDWFENGVKTEFDLVEMFDRREKMKDSYSKIQKMLNRKTAFTRFETDIINKWFNEFNFSYEIVEEALKKTTRISNPNIAYVDKILTTWYENQFESIEDVKKENALKDLTTNDLRMMVHEHYQEINLKNSMLFETRKSEVFAKVPRIEALYNEINDLYFKQAFSVDKKSVAEEIKDKKYEMSLLFEKHKIPEDYLTRSYDCNICKDTGIDNGKDCSCKLDFLKSISNK